MPAARTGTKASKAKSPTKAAARMTLAETMKALEKAGEAQTKKTYARHGASEPMFGVRFGTLAVLVKKIGAAPNAIKDPMNMALVAIGGRSEALKKAALAAAKRIGPVDVDHGDTACETPAAAPYLEKTWERAKSGGFASPSAQ